MVKTKIICTLGPASSAPAVLRKMVFSGLDVARLNFSHGSRREHIQRLALIREINRKYRRSIKVLGDLEGYRVRVGKFKGSAPIEIKKRQVVWLTQNAVLGEEDIIPFDYYGDLSVIRAGQYIYIDDGNIALRVVNRKKRSLKTEAIQGGILKEHKGVNIPGAKLRFSGLTAKDMQDIRFCADKQFDYIAQSFVRTKYDILKIRELLKDYPPRIRIIAKIESREGINNIDEIIKASDGIMIARGDMGVSIPIYEIPVVQKEIIKKCNRAGKFVITATQMLESMTENLRPTRAEVTDVANAIIDGSDYLMLSAETAVGRYPVETVHMMNQIIKFTESHIKLTKTATERMGR